MDDEFGRDPAVLSMRRVFAHMEVLQRSIIEAASLPPYDRRLALWREQALLLFEQAWPSAGRRGLTKTEDEAALLYALCFVRILERGRITVPSSAMPVHEALQEIVQEILK